MEQLDSDVWPSLSVSTHGIIYRWTYVFAIVILVGTAREWLPELIERSKKLVVNGGFEKGADLCVLK